MNIGSFEMVNFTSHKKTLIKLPEQGVVVVTGPNGAGKSSFVEAVAWCFWGKTLRGTPPWNGDAKSPCKVRVVTEELGVERSRSGGKTELSWEHFVGSSQGAPGAASDDPEYETPTKAQEALETFLGCGFELWRKSHVFSSSDAAHYTVATDADRKRLIEGFLGVDRFDPALKACRADLKTAETLLSERTRRREVSGTKLEAARLRLDEAKKGLAASKPPAPAPKAKPGKPLSDYDAQITAAKKELRGLQNKRLELVGADGQLGAHVAQAKALLERLRGDKCPTCTQAITPAFKKKLTEQMNAAKEEADAEKEAGKEEVESLKSTIVEIEDELAAIERKRAERAQEVQAERLAKEEVERYTRSRELLDKARQQSDEAVFTLTEELQTLEADIASAESDVAELTQCEKVLGTRGVRAHILGESLSGIEGMANAWLARLSDKATIRLSPYSENKSNDNVQDKISLEIVGAGDGKGYKANSGGERRRLDVSLLLALAEVAAASQGHEVGTLFFDEVFDCLDDDGVAAIAEALGELAEKRCVVVITHSEVMRMKLSGARRLHVEDGEARWVA